MQGLENFAEIMNVFSKKIKCRALNKPSPQKFDKRNKAIHLTCDFSTINDHKCQDPAEQNLKT